MGYTLGYKKPIREPGRGVYLSTLEVAAHLGISKQMVARIERVALRKVELRLKEEWRKEVALRG